MNSATCLLQPYRVQSDKTSLVLARYEAGDYFLSNGGVASERKGRFPPPQIGLKATVNLQTKQSHKSSTGCFVDRKLWFTFFSEYKLEVPWI